MKPKPRPNWTFLTVPFVDISCLLPSRTLLNDTRFVREGEDEARAIPASWRPDHCNYTPQALLHAASPSLTRVRPASKPWYAHARQLSGEFDAAGRRDFGPASAMTTVWLCYDARMK